MIPPKSRDRCPATEIRQSIHGDITVRCVERRGHDKRIQPCNWMGRAFRKPAA